MLSDHITSLIDVQVEGDRQFNVRKIREYVETICGPLDVHHTKRHCSYTELCEALGFYTRPQGAKGGSNLIRDWISGKRPPSHRNLVILEWVAKGYIKVQFIGNRLGCSGSRRRKAKVTLNPDIIWQVCRHHLHLDNLEGVKSAVRVWAQLVGVKVVSSPHRVKLLDADGELLGKIVYSKDGWELSTGVRVSEIIAWAKLSHSVNASIMKQRSLWD